MSHLFSKKKQLSRFYPLLFLLIGTIVCFLFALQFEVYEGGADNYIHYRVSRYSFTYPHLLLDHWGKPVFTLLSSPFAQFGFQGLVFFNVLCGVLASFFAFKAAQLIGLKESWSVVIITLCMPIYFIMMVSAMTEVLFSFLIIFAIYLLLKEKYILSAIVFSLLFLVRTEAYILYPFILFVFAYKKQWKSIPFIATGFIVYSLIGWFHFGDFLWLIHQNPYGDATDLYGKGELLYFVKKYKEISGKPAGVLIFIGVIISTIQFVHHFITTKKLKTDFILIEILFMVYFAAHSYVWWSGTGASAGLIRVMAAIVPLMAISALRTLDYFSRFNPFEKKYYSIAVGAICLYLFFVPFKVYPLPLKYGEKEKTIAASIDWFQHSKYKDAKVYFYEPLVYFLLDRDPFDHSVIKELIDDRDHPEKSVKNGEIVFYDMHFGPNEGRLPLERLMDNPHFVLVNYFEPLNEMIVLGGYAYGILLFERVNSHSENNYELLEKFKKEKIISTPWLTNKNNNTRITTEEFTPLQEISVSEINELNSYQIILSKIRYEIEEVDADVMLVISVEKGGESKIYQAVQLIADGKTHETENSMVISYKIDGDEILKIYIWNKSGTKGKVHELNVSLVKKTY